MSNVEEVVQAKSDEVYSNKIAMVETSKFDVENQNTTATKREKMWKQICLRKYQKIC